MSKQHYDSRRRTKSQASDDDEEGGDSYGAVREKAAAIIPLKKMIESFTPAVSGPPHGEEEKRIFYTALVRLRQQRLTHKMCGEKLGVSERSISTYLADPLYREIQDELINDSRLRGHLTVSDLVDEALTKIYMLMQGANSEFVRFKSAEYILNASGFNIPRDEAQADSREGIIKFLAEVEASRTRQGQTTVNVQINSQDASGSVGSQFIEAIPAGVRQTYQPVLPGGRLPGAVTPEIGKVDPVASNDDNLDDLEDTL